MTIGSCLGERSGGRVTKQEDAAPVPPDRPVLVVDDDANTRKGLAELLKLRRFKVITAANGAEALQQAREHRPCLILLDLVMPVMDGEQFRGEQQRDSAIKDIPVILFSGQPGCMETARRLGALGCLQKPISFHEVVQEVTASCATLTAD
jgi:CheY-like chemotaxis protein